MHNTYHTIVTICYITGGGNRFCEMRGDNSPAKFKSVATVVILLCNPFGRSQLFYTQIKAENACLWSIHFILDVCQKRHAGLFVLSPTIITFEDDLQWYRHVY